MKYTDNYDYYTTSSASSGNKALTYPIALITLDEIVLAGNAATYYDRSYSASFSYDSYLMGTTGFFTMTPSGFFYLFGYKNILAMTYDIAENGKVAETYTHNLSGLRPVINLKSTLKFTGDGTKNNPYIPSL